jgi:hypothetical protein
MQMILNSEFSGEITSIPPKSVAFCGRTSTAPIANTSPSVATAEHNANARVLARPMAITASAVTTMTASGDASLSNSR